MSQGAVMRSDDGRVTTPEKFWALVDAAGPDRCWPWLGRCDEKGYGCVGFQRRPGVGTHRVAWMLTRGEIPAGQHVLHHCDNPPCCNPTHLFLGTQADNNRDRHLKGRSKNLDPGEAHPKAKLTNEQVRRIRVEYERGLTTQQALAERWEISRGNLSKILSRKAYIDA